MSLLPRKYYFNDFFDDFDLIENNKKNLSCDIYEQDNKYHIIMDTPGFSKEDISIKFCDNYLTIELSKNLEDESKDKNYIRRERTFGKFKRQFYLEHVNDEEIDAEFKDGILTIIIPKIDEKKTSKEIEIK